MCAFCSFCTTVCPKNLQKELFITWKVSIIIIHLALHVKEEHTIILVAGQSFGKSSIIVAEIVKTQFFVFQTFLRVSGCLVRHSSVILLSAPLAKRRLCMHLSFDVSRQKSRTRQVRRPSSPVFRSLHPNPVIVALPSQISACLSVLKIETR